MPTPSFRATFRIHVDNTPLIGSDDCTTTSQTVRTKSVVMSLVNAAVIVAAVMAEIWLFRHHPSLTSAGVLLALAISHTWTSYKRARQHGAATPTALNRLIVPGSAGNWDSSSSPLSRGIHSVLDEEDVVPSLMLLPMALFAEKSFHQHQITFGHNSIYFFASCIWSWCSGGPRRRVADKAASSPSASLDLLLYGAVSSIGVSALTQNASLGLAIVSFLTAAWVTERCFANVQPAASASLAKPTENRSPATVKRAGGTPPYVLPSPEVHLIAALCGLLVSDFATNRRMARSLFGDAVTTPAHVVGRAALVAAWVTCVAMRTLTVAARSASATLPALRRDRDDDVGVAVSEIFLWLRHLPVRFCVACQRWPSILRFACAAGVSVAFVYVDATHRLTVRNQAIIASMAASATAGADTVRTSSTAAVTPSDPTVWLIHYLMLDDPIRLVCLLCWFGAIPIAAGVTFFIASGQKVPRIVARKFFHFVAVAAFWMPSIYDGAFVALSIQVALALMILLEAARQYRVWGTGWLTRSLAKGHVTDARDEGVVRTHIYLLAGILFPLFIRSRTEFAPGALRSAAPNWMQDVARDVLPGLGCVGLLDALAAVVGVLRYSAPKNGAHEDDHARRGGGGCWIATPTSGPVSSWVAADCPSLTRKTKLGTLTGIMGTWLAYATTVFFIAVMIAMNNNNSSSDGPPTTSSQQEGFREGAIGNVLVGVLQSLAFTPKAMQALFGSLAALTWVGIFETTSSSGADNLELPLLGTALFFCV